MNRSLKKINHLKSSKKLHVYKAFKYTYYYFNIIAIWPLIFENYNIKKIFTSIHVFIVIFSLAWQIVFRFCHAYFYAINIDDQVTFLGPMIFILVSLLKYLSIIYRSDFINKSIDHIYTDWSLVKCQEEEDIMITKVAMCNKITFTFSVIMYASALFYNFIMPHVIPLVIHSDYQNTTERLIIFPGYNVIKVFDSSPLYEISYLFHIITIFFCFTVLVATCNFIVFLLTHTDGQLDIITVQLKSLIDRVNKVKFSYTKLSTVVQNHVRILQFTEKILKKILSEICIVEIGGTTILLCVAEFCSLRFLGSQDYVDVIPYIMLFSGLSLNMLILCYFSEIINSQFFRIGLRLYETDWDLFPLNARKYLILIISMSQRTQKISAGGVIDLSFITYLQIIKTGFAYLQILRASNVQK